MNNIETEIELLPILLVECIINRDFFNANNIKARQEELRNWINMNSGIIGGAYKRK